jgi:hypothetical protein
MDRARALMLAVCLVASTLSGGCQSLRNGNWRGEGYDDSINQLTENLRPPGNEKSFAGIDARAREIERNLGVR